MSGLEFEICGSWLPFGRVLAVLADSGMDRAGIKSLALTMEYFGDGVDKGNSYSESLVLGEADGTMFAESFFEFRMRECQDRGKDNLFSHPETNETLGAFVDGVGKIVMDPKSFPTVPVCPVYCDEDLSGMNGPPQVEPVGEGIKYPIGLEPVDNVSMAGCESKVVYWVTVCVGSNGRGERASGCTVNR